MFDSDRAKQLQRQSHVRGMLSKQFYSGEQSDLQKKRKQMKRILDEQVQERRKVKQKEKMQKQRAIKQQQQQIKRYYEEVVHRDRRLSDNNSGAHIRPEASRAKQFSKNQTSDRDPNQSRVKKYHDQSVRQKSKSKPSFPNEIQGGDMPLLTVMASSDGPYSNPSHNQSNHSESNSAFNQNSRYEFENQNAGNIPLLDLAEESKFLKTKKKSKAQLIRQKTERDHNHITSNPRSGENVNNNFAVENVAQFSPPHNNSSVHNNHPQNRHQRRKTFGQEDNTSLAQQFQPQHLNSRVSSKKKSLNQKHPPSASNNQPMQDSRHQNQNSYQKQLIRSPSQSNRQLFPDQHEQIQEQIEQMQSENKQLKSDLKKSQQAISLLIGAVRSNAKLDKFRIKAEKILYNENQSKVSNFNKQTLNDKRQQSPLHLPKLKIHHQSIMHDYMINAAKKKFKSALRTK